MQGKSFKTNMKKITLSVIFTFVLTIISPFYTQAFFAEDIDSIVAENSGDTVQNVSATPGNGSVILIWDAKQNPSGQDATSYRVEYGTASVEGGVASEYELQQTTVDSYPTLKIDDLTNGTKYYFSVIALFSDGSETNRSAEVSATPLADLNQEMSDTPLVVSAEARTENSFVVFFSEDIVLPEENPESAFAVSPEESPDTLLEVISAEYDINKNGEKQLGDVLVTLADPTENGTSYRVTASAQIVDLDGNPIESGSTDSAVFVGVAHASAEPVAATPSNDTNALGDGITLEEILSSLADETSSSPEQAAEEKNTADIDPNDTTPPEDITDLTATVKARLIDFLVTLKWKASQNSAGDLADQILYRSENKGDLWEQGKSLGKDTTKTAVVEQPETEITYKITTKDVNGNESVGVIRSVRIPMLPETGAGFAFVGALAMAGAMGVRRRMKK